MSYNLKKTLLTSTVFVGAAAIAGPAFAQAEPAETPAVEADQAADDAAGEEIIVTGTLIRNPNLEASSPVSVIGQDEVELQQANVAEELLRELPGAVPSVGSAVNNGNGGASFVNLRGVGENRNVVLVDGVRLVPANLAAIFDLNNIPLALIERTEVLTGGASTTYGADAIGGVVNFITRSDFSGLEVTASQQITEQGDGNQFRVDATIGANFDDGRGNVVFSIGYQQSDPVYQGARDYAAFAIDSFAGVVAGSGLSPAPSTFGGVNITGTDNGNGLRQVTADGTGFRPPSQNVPFNFNPFNVFQTPFERFNMYGAANYEVSDAIEIYTRGIFSKNVVETVIAPSGAFGLPVNISLNNPFLSAAQRNAFCAFDINPAAGVYTPRFSQAECDAAATASGPGDPNYREVGTDPVTNPQAELRRRAVEVGPRISEYTTTFFDYRLGFRGDITDSIGWDVFGAYGESENTNLQQGYTLNSRTRQSLLINRDPETGAATCQDDSFGCVPVDFFGPVGNSSFTPAAIDFLNENSTVTTKTSLAQARATISGDFGWTIPWAEDPISFAVGGEYRRYTASQVSDSLSQGGDLGGAGGAAPNIDGAYEVYEAIGELIVPVVQNRPFFEELTIEGGIRYSSYKVDAPGQPSFNTTTWKVGGQWEPGAGLKFRGNYAKAVRAPNIAELFSPVNTVLTNLADEPCASLDEAGNRIRPAPTGVLRAVCLAQGATELNVDNIQVPAAGQANQTSGGNLNLEPEEADTYTFGVVWTPDFVPGFTASLDYFNIKVDGAVSSPTPGDAISACFDNLSTTNPACLSIRRNSLNGSLSGDPTIAPGLSLALSNLGALENSGVDLVMNYRQDLGFAALSLGFVGTYNIDSKFNANTLVATSLNRECVNYYSVNCGTIQPEFQWSQRTTLTFGDVDVSVLWRHVDAVQYEPQSIVDGGEAFIGNLPNDPRLPGSLQGSAVNFNQIDAYDYFDLTTRFSVTDNFVLTLSVQNLFDKTPPLVGYTIGSTTYNSGNTYPSTYDALGRRFAASARLRF